MKHKLPLVLLAVFAFLATAASTFAQSQTITHAEYWAGIRSGLTSARKLFPWRETKTYEGFTDGKLTYSRIEKSEYQAADTSHIVIETLRDAEKSVDEKIQVGAIRYCKENSGEWKTSGCYDRPPAPLENAEETTYKRQVHRDSTAYNRSASFFLKANGEMTMFLTEDTFIVNADLSVRERTIIKSVRETKKIASRESQKFEYGLKLKPIEAPIK